jgi:hypothetical protein
MTPLTQLSFVAAITPQEVFGVGVKVLAVLGGALIGGVVAGWLGKFVLRFVTKKPMPPFLLGIVRLAGAVGGGWLVFLFVFGGGGSGVGGEGGTSTGNRNKDAAEQSKDEKQKDADKKKDKEGATPEKSKTIEVTLLGPELAESVERCYRIEGDPSRKMYTLKELTELIVERLKDTPGLKVILNRYKDSPTDKTQAYDNLYNWLNIRQLIEKDNQYLDKATPR